MNPTAAFLLVSFLSQAPRVVITTTTVAPDYQEGDLIQEVWLDDFASVAEDNGGDWAPAIEAAAMELDDIDGPDHTLGGTIRLSCNKDYTILSTVDVCSSLLIEGCGTGRGLFGNEFVVENVHAIRTWAVAEDCPYQLDQDVTPHLTIEHLGIRNRIVNSSTLTYAINAKTPVFLHDVHIRRFVQGVRFVCDVTSSPATNCNHSELMGVFIDECQHMGLFAAGGDANVITMVAVNANSNCRNAAAWNAALLPQYCVDNPAHEACELPCADIWDNGFLGNTGVGLHVASARDISQVPPVDYPGYVAAGDNIQSSVVGLYTEFGVNSHIARRSNVWGGPAKIDRRGGLHVIGATINRGIFVNDQDPLNIVQVRLGRSINDPGTFMTLERLIGQTEEPWPFRFSYDSVSEVLFWDLGNTKRVFQLGILQPGNQGGAWTLPGTLSFTLP